MKRSESESTLSAHLSSNSVDSPSIQNLLKTPASSCRIIYHELNHSGKELSSLLSPRIEDTEETKEAIAVRALSNSTDSNRTERKAIQ